MVMAQTTVKKVWRKAPYNPLRTFIPNGTAITKDGFNRHTGQPVNLQGIVYETWVLSTAFLQAFPDSPTKVNYAVDRKQGHSKDPGAPWSDHAFGSALDIISSKRDGKKGVSQIDIDWGERVFAWFVEQMREGGAKGVGLRGKTWAGRYRIEYVMFNGKICRASEGCVVRPIRKGDPHRDHVHVSLVPVDRRTLPILKRGSTGEPVKRVQAAIGALVDGKFGPQTERLLKTWQDRAGLAADGVVDADDWIYL